MKIIMKNKQTKKQHNTNKYVKINRNLICTYKSAMFSTQYASNSPGTVMKHLTSFYRYRQ